MGYSGGGGGAACGGSLSPVGVLVAAESLRGEELARAVMAGEHSGSTTSRFSFGGSGFFLFWGFFAGNGGGGGSNIGHGGGNGNCVIGTGVV